MLEHLHRMLRIKVSFGSDVSIHFKNLQRIYNKTWYSTKQLNHNRQLLSIKPTNVFQHLEPKNMVNSFYYIHRTGVTQPLCCLTGSYSKFFQNSTKEKISEYKQYNNIQKFGFCKDQQPAQQNSSSGLGSSPGPQHTDEHWGPFILNRIHQLEESSRFHGYSTLRWGFSGIVVLLTCIYLFRDRLRDNVADEVADVASRSMADENVVMKAHGLTKEVLERLVSEPETINLASDFVKGVMQRDDVRKTAVEFTSSLLNHSATQEKIQEITRNTIQSILNNEETKSMLLRFIKSLIDDEQTKEACHQLLLSLTKDAGIQELVADFFKSVLASPKFQMEAVMLGREVTNNVVHDKNIQKETGDALWSAVKYGITPHWFRGD